MTTVNLLNVDTPAPRWYRKTKRLVGLMAGPGFTSIFSAFNMSDHTIAKITLIISWLPTLMEVLNALLNDDQEYAPKGSKQALADATGAVMKEPDSGITTTPSPLK